VQKPDSERITSKNGWERMLAQAQIKAIVDCRKDGAMAQTHNHLEDDISRDSSEKSRQLAHGNSTLEFSSQTYPYMKVGRQIRYSTDNFIGTGVWRGSHACVGSADHVRFRHAGID
jgi:hypothetical protein